MNDSSSRFVKRRKDCAVKSVEGTKKRTPTKQDNLAEIGVLLILAFI